MAIDFHVFISPISNKGIFHSPELALHNTSPFQVDRAINDSADGGYFRFCTFTGRWIAGISEYLIFPGWQHGTRRSSNWISQSTLICWMIGRDVFNESNARSNLSQLESRRNYNEIHYNKTQIINPIGKLFVWLTPRPQCDLKQMRELNNLICSALEQDLSILTAPSWWVRKTSVKCIDLLRLRTSSKAVRRSSLLFWRDQYLLPRKLLVVVDWKAPE